VPKKMTHDIFVQRVELERNSEFEVLSGYVNFQTKVKVRHIRCGSEYEITPANLLHYKTDCRRCFLEDSGVKRRMGIEKFTAKFEKIYGKDEYLVLGKYIDAHTKILIKHKCGTEHEFTPTNFLKGHGCPTCAGFKRRTQKDFIKDVYERVGNEYTVLGKFKGVDEKVLVRHNICGLDMEVRPADFLRRGSGCPSCISSSGEKQIASILDEFYCRYQKEYTIDDCKLNRKLRFDFAIFKQNSLIMLIEYDGIQHFKVTGGWGTEENFKVTQLRDKIKNEYCENKGIPLIRIPYWEKDNAKEIIKKELSIKLNKQCSLPL
jgi:hypothetical protein